MSIELPALRLGLAGFSDAQRVALDGCLQRTTSAIWHIGQFADADAWWVNGARAGMLPDGTIRIDAGEPGGHPLHLDLRDVDRPVAFALPLAAQNLAPAFTFEAGSASSVAAVLEKIEAWLRPLIAQFCLASSILEHERVLGPGIHQVSADGALIGVVNMHGETGVMPTAGPVEFENAMWEPVTPGNEEIPGHFVRSSLARLMWQFAMRTSRDVLPARYRTGRLFFRRAPRLPPRLMTDTHLVLLRELACAPRDFEGLRQRTGIGSVDLARDLAALYLVGAITSNVKRAAPLHARLAGDAEHSGQHSIAPSGMDSDPVAGSPGKAPVFADLTAPAPIAGR